MGAGPELLGAPAASFRDLPAGRYTVWAGKGGYVEVQFGQRRPFEAGRPIQLADGEVLEKLEVVLPRGSVITGRVVDEFGEPVAEASVQALRLQIIDGRRRLVGAGRRAPTDDLGSFRLFGLPPGRYYISATMRSFGADPDEPVGYAPTYYPGTPEAALAQAIVVGVGQEMTGVDFPLFVTRTARISGRVVNSAGRPVTEGGVMLFQSEPADGGGMMFGGSRGGRIRDDGSFEIRNIPPGEYVLRYDAFGNREHREIAMANVTVAGADIDGIVLTTTTGATAAGWIVFEGATGAERPAPQRLFVSSEAAQLDDLMPFGVGRARVNADLSFELTGLYGSRLIRAGGTEGWSLKAVLLGNTDVTDTPIPFKGTERVEGLRIVLTNRTTELTGTASDERGELASDYVVVVFPEDRERWGYRSRFVKTARPDQAGVFEIEALPPATYLAFATEWLEDGAWTDPELLERVRPYATRFELGEGERRAIILKLTSVP